MKVYNYSEARQNFSTILNTALKEDVIIKRKDGSKFKLISIHEDKTKSPFEVKGIDCKIKKKEILEFIREGREY